MMDENSPFWATPPYILLTDVLQLDKVEPWNVDVGKLVVGFLNEMKRMGDIDFRISGNALYSASVIFMRKTRELVELGILPPETDDDDVELEIPLIRPPFRLTNRRVTIEELLIAMDHVLSKGPRTRRTLVKHQYRSKDDTISLTMNDNQANIEETIAEVYADLQKILKVGDISKFTDILMNNTRREIVRVFFAILFLYARAFIDIWMDENVIWIKMVETPEVDEEESEEIELPIES
jgi:segregation and condensation protein A